MSTELLDLGEEMAVEFDESANAESAPKYLTFIVADEVYGVPIAHIAEIIGAQRFTPVPDPRPYMRGVINLRGTVIPVLDVRTRLAMEPREVDRRTCIVVVQLDDTSVGLLVDTISDVIDVPPCSIEDAPRRKKSMVRDSVVTGLVQIEGKVRILIDLGRLLDDVAAIPEDSPGDLN
ncbi:MAG: purine-binding chemotaxis protein CheW [bacterium]|nr:purine-binding chemotaxis protein CheW [bacterium]